jgi:hypothetical protein
MVIGWTDEDLPKMGPARIGEKQFPAQLGCGDAECLGHEIEYRHFGIGHFERPLQARLELGAAGEIQLFVVSSGPLVLDP